VSLCSRCLGYFEEQPDAVLAREGSVCAGPATSHGGGAEICGGAGLPDSVRVAKKAGKVESEVVGFLVGNLCLDELG
jgi:hypothetical protein